MTSNTKAEAIDQLVIDRDTLRTAWRTCHAKHHELRAENERLIDMDDRLRAALDRVGSTCDILRAENEGLRAIVEPAREFLRWHERGQPGMPDTLYPMTYGALDEWHAEWDRRLQALADAFDESYQSGAVRSSSIHSERGIRSLIRG